LIRSTVLAPIDPVAPSNVTLRSLPAAVKPGFTAVFAFIRSPYQEAAGGCMHTAMGQADQAGKHGRGDKTIQAVH
jgi:hypothetical protein